MSGEGPPLRAVGAALRPHWAALAALAALALAGLAALGDYGVFYDDEYQRSLGVANIDYVTGVPAWFPEDHNKFYGALLESPLVLAERALGVEGDRSVYIMRQAARRLFFLIGGLFAYLLARRLFSGGRLALFAMALFLLHPWMHAHSFLNSKDIPFLSMFVIALFLIHRAFKRDALWAFALAGAGVGMLMNLRVMGFALLGGALALRALDLFAAQSGEERRRALLGAAAFAFAAALMVYASLPYLWENPARVVEWLTTLSRHPQNELETFRGALIWSKDVPADYVPTWFSITTPPFALLLGAVGAVALLRRFGARPRDILRNTRLRFAALLIGTFVLPVAAVVLLGSTTYGGWRHLFFAWAPFSLLAAFGLRRLAEAFGRKRLRAAVYAAAVAGLGATAILVALLHPFQHAYFNFFVDRATPERLNAQYYARHVGNGAYQALRRLLDERADESVSVARDQAAMRGVLMLPQARRERIALVGRPTAAFSIKTTAPGEEEKTLASGRAFGNTLWAVVKEPDGNPLIGAYERATADEPVALGAWSVYLNREERALVYAQDPSAETNEDDHFYLFVYPERAGDLRDWERETGRANLSFNLYEHGAAFDGKRVAAVSLPNYEIAGIRTGQVGDDAWEAVFPFADPATLRAAFNAAATREPDARAEFNVYADGEARRLVYAKEPCSQSDASERFFLHIVPERVSDLPDDMRERGFENRDFEFLLRGIMFDGKCAAAVPLPDYAIARARTGQHIAGVEEIWSAEFNIGE